MLAQNLTSAQPLQLRFSVLKVLRLHLFEQQVQTTLHFINSASFV
jgi:hypothetical protein